MTIELVRPPEPGTGPAAAAPPVLDVVVPVHNELVDLAPSIRRLVAYLETSFPVPARVTIADNASSDGTWELACELATELPCVRAVRLPEKGRGRALRQVWADNDAAVLAYMDVDLSTDLNALLPLVAPLLSGHSDVAIGNRLARSSRVRRGSRREVISRGYNLLLHATLQTRFADAQCGFKAIRADRARVLLPHVQDAGWFFDTELLVLAERAGLRISEVPVDWADDPDSRVELLPTAIADVRGIIRMARDLASGRLPLARLRAQLGTTPPTAPASTLVQVFRFCAVGVLSTLAYLLLYLLLRTGATAQVANVVALLLTAVGNTALNRRWTFGVRGVAGALRHQVYGLAAFGLALLITSGSLAGLLAVSARPSRGAEVLVLSVANLVATAARFLVLRRVLGGTR